MTGAATRLAGNNRLRYAFFRKRLPVRARTVLLLADSDGALVDSPFYLMRYLLAHTDLEVFTASHDVDGARRKLAAYGMQPTVVSWTSREFPRLLATAEFLVTNSALPTYFTKRPGQTLMNMWHGTPLKTLGYDMKTPWAEISQTQSQFMMADYLLYPNEVAMRRIMESYHLDALFANKVVLCGYPRTAALLDGARRRELREAFGFGAVGGIGPVEGRAGCNFRSAGGGNGKVRGKRVFAYLPTWRGAGVYDQDTDVLLAKLRGNLAELDALLDDDIVLLVKAHRFMKGGIVPEGARHVAEFDEAYETYDVLNACDGLVTDYSSVMFDFAASARPIFLFPYDVDEYLASRGLYEDPRDLPFPAAETPGRLADLLNEWNDGDPLPDGYGSFVATYCARDSAGSAAEVAKVLLGDEGGSEIIDFSSNAERAWHLRTQLDDGLGDDDLLVFPRATFTPELERQLREARPPCPVLIAPDQPPFTLLDHARVFLHCGRKARLLDESRVLPGITVKDEFGGDRCE